jgi:signal peptidase I
MEFIVGKSIGDSMFPFIKEGDTLIIKNLDYKEIVIGDVIVCSNNGNLIAHRLIKKYRDFALTKPDGYLKFQYDPLIKRENIKGTVIFIRKNNKLINIKYTRFLYLFQAYCPFLWWIILILLKLKEPSLFFKKIIIKTRRMLK